MTINQKQPDANEQIDVPEVQRQDKEKHDAEVRNPSKSGRDDVPPDEKINAERTDVERRERKP